MLNNLGNNNFRAKTEKSTKKNSVVSKEFVKTKEITGNGDGVKSQEAENLDLKDDGFSEKSTNGGDIEERLKDVELEEEEAKMTADVSYNLNGANSKS